MSPTREARLGKRKQPVSFHAEVTQRFQFLVEELHFDGPKCSEVLLPAVRYTSAGLGIGIFFNNDAHDGAGRGVSVSITLDIEQGRVKADLDQLVEAAVFAPRHRVAWKAHTADAMRNTLDDNATWLRRLMPILRGPQALDTIRNASNPKPRQPNTQWKHS